MWLQNKVRKFSGPLSCSLVQADHSDCVGLTWFPFCPHERWKLRLLRLGSLSRSLSILLSSAYPSITEPFPVQLPVWSLRVEHLHPICKCYFYLLLLKKVLRRGVTFLARCLLKFMTKLPIKQNCLPWIPVRISYFRHSKSDVAFGEMFNIKYIRYFWVNIVKYYIYLFFILI